MKEMANVTVKDIPDRVHQDLKAAAQAEGKSLNAYILSLLELSTDERWRRRMMRSHRDEFRRFVETLPAMDDSTKLIREDRERDR